MLGTLSGRLARSFTCVPLLCDPLDRLPALPAMPPVTSSDPTQRRKRPGMRPPSFSLRELFVYLLPFVAASRTIIFLTGRSLPGQRPAARPVEAMVLAPPLRYMARACTL